MKRKLEDVGVTPPTKFRRIRQPFKGEEIIHPEGVQYGDLPIASTSTIKDDGLEEWAKQVDRLALRSANIKHEIEALRTQAAGTTNGGLRATINGEINKLRNEAARIEAAILHQSPSMYERTHPKTTDAEKVSAPTPSDPNAWYRAWRGAGEGGGPPYIPPDEPDEGPLQARTYTVVPYDPLRKKVEPKIPALFRIFDKYLGWIPLLSPGVKGGGRPTVNTEFAKTLTRTPDMDHEMDIRNLDKPKGWKGVMKLPAGFDFESFWNMDEHGLRL